jgi:hypothetical protein
MDCATSCAAGMYREGSCSGLGTVDTVLCIPCPAGTFSLGAGAGVSTCVPCQNGTFSDPGSSSCDRISSCWPFNTNGNVYRSDASASAYVPSAGISFQSDTVLSRRRSFVSFSGSTSSYSSAPDGGCSSLPLRELSVSLWVRIDGVQHARSGFIGCFKSSAAGGDGWLLGTTVDGKAFAFVMRSEGTAAASMIADMTSQIDLGTWYVSVCVRCFVFVIAKFEW